MKMMRTNGLATSTMNFSRDLMFPLMNSRGLGEKRRIMGFNWSMGTRRPESRYGGSSYEKKPSFGEEERILLAMRDLRLLIQKEVQKMQLRKLTEEDGSKSVMGYIYVLSYQRTWKPFNLILGETCELANYKGVNFISEQVCHHPPMSAGHAENEHFAYDCTSKLKTNFLGSSIDVYPVGRTRVTLKRDGVVLDLVPPLTKAHNLIFGRTWVDSPGEMIMTNLTTGDKVVVYFRSCGWFGSGRYEVDGYVYNASEEPKILMTGKWNESMSY